MTTVSEVPPGTGESPSDATTRQQRQEPLLRVEDLSVSYGRRATARRREGSTRVLSGVDLAVRPGEIVGIIGETGSGKTTLARAVVGLKRPDAGRIAFDGRDLTRLAGRGLRAFRRSGQLQYMFQDPLRSLDPESTVRQTVAEPLAVAGTLTRDEREERVTEALTLVGLDAGELGARTPGLISGGQRQRVALARALVTRPRLLLTDEPVSALDASNRNLVLSLLDRLRRELGLAVVVISHDLGSLAGIADRVAVLYRGRLVEQGRTADVLERPRHPYTALLTASAPSVRREPRLLPALLRVPASREPWPEDEGCVFAPRCRFAAPECRDEPAATVVDEPAPSGTGTGTERATVACHRAADWRAELG
ncbi:oligopeptide/dipeptide ABC transporter ATP-binding protein [Streptomyces sp. Amel2xB2]|uniref:ABC transporter ATP-binding protein n=1 Tax=Streptomyces sp. Amel2xB2 TaxID=1305829 RepID=UPI000DBA07A9|nr:ABC transporter ATP-binding protein [Streptomyces sp. Amel2xB2]RAJ58353.1 oligopeptide/dipeptide ABC transporter ATP-binding protein [Streptomyces sp. Amel2xB2]